MSDTPISDERREPPKRFPLQARLMHHGHRDPPITIPWSHAQEAYAYYASQYGTQQSLERLAERGGFGADEVVALLVGRIGQLRKLVKQATV